MPSEGIKSAQSDSRTSPLVAPTSKASKPTKTDMRGVNNSDGLSRATPTLMSSVVRQNVTGISTSPDKENASGAFGIDAYRDGGFTGGEDSMRQKYTLSDYEAREEAATISLVAKDGTDIISAYGRFILQAVNEAESEKYQVVETFTQFYTFFYGKRPAVYRYAGILIDDPNFRWSNEFRFMYDNFFRGTVASELDATCVFQYSGRAVTGMILGMSINQQSLDPKAVNFTVDLLVLDYTNNTFSADVEQLLRDKQTEIKNLKEQIQKAMAETNKDVPTEPRLTAGQVFNGKAPAAKAKKPTDSAKKDKPISSIAPKPGFF